MLYEIIQLRVTNGIRAIIYRILAGKSAAGLPNISQTVEETTASEFNTYHLRDCYIELNIRRSLDNKSGP